MPEPDYETKNFVAFSVIPRLATALLDDARAVMEFFEELESQGYAPLCILSEGVVPKVICRKTVPDTMSPEDRRALRHILADFDFAAVHAYANNNTPTSPDMLAHYEIWRGGIDAVRQSAESILNDCVGKLNNCVGEGWGMTADLFGMKAEIKRIDKGRYSLTKMQLTFHGIGGSMIAHSHIEYKRD